MSIKQKPKTEDWFEIVIQKALDKKHNSNKSMSTKQKNKNL
jgi:hypothetical protein